MDTVRLRTLTEKSVIGFGRYSDSTVGMLISYEKTHYLRWCYFNFESITFTDDILSKIHIPNNFRINKPGKDLIKHTELNEHIMNKIPAFAKLKKESHLRRVRMASYVSAKKQDLFYYSKGNLQRKNHGVSIGKQKK